MWRRLKRLWQLSGTTEPTLANQRIVLNGSLKVDGHALAAQIRNLERQGIK